MSLKTWIKQKMPDKVFAEGIVDRYIMKDFELAPKPEDVVRIGLAPTIADANVLIAKDKTLWGGTRNHAGLDDMETSFGSVFPATLAFGAKPIIHAALQAANNKPDPADATKTIDLGYLSVFDDWFTKGFIK